MPNLLSTLFSRPAFLAAALLLFFFANENLPAQEQLQKPDWAAGEKPVVVRGKITGYPATGLYNLAAPNGHTFLLVEPGRGIKEFLNLNVEATGWTGEVEKLEGIQLLRLTKPLVVLVPAWWSAPFLLLLLCMAFLPFVHKHFWETNYQTIALLLGVFVAALYVSGLGLYGRQRMAEMGLEYFKFIALLGSLFVVSGGIIIDLPARATPLANTVLLACGAVLANVFGTTGASVLLIRPFLRANRERLKPFHIVLFICIVSNCGGALTPIGDPPLFLGYLFGVPFFWMLFHGWQAWLLTIGLLLLVFFVLDRKVGESAVAPEKKFEGGLHIAGGMNFLWLGVILAGIFLDQFLSEHVAPALRAYPLGALLMLLAACAAYAFSARENLARNKFNFAPLREVAFLFMGIFATMAPALDYLSANAAPLGLVSPGGFYCATGLLSSVLDNAPAYLSFLAAAHGLKEIPLAREFMPEFISQYPQYLLAISLGSVFFGACTYIGNGPNFMVKAIAEASGARVPGFFAYTVKYALPILAPIYALVWWLFLR